MGLYLLFCRIFVTRQKTRASLLYKLLFSTTHTFEFSLLNTAMLHLFSVKIINYFH